MYHFSYRNIGYRNSLLLNDRRSFYVMSSPTVNSNIMIANEIERIYNDEWMINRGVLPQDKDELQHRLVRSKSTTPILEQILFSYYKIAEIPEFVYNGIVNEAKAGCGSATVLKDSGGELWLFTYETDRPEDALLLTAATNIMLRTYVRIPLNMPKQLKKITQLHDYHYEFLNTLTNVKSIHHLRLLPIQFSRYGLVKNSKVIYHNNGMLLQIIQNSLDMVILNVNNGNLFYDVYPSPLGDFTTTLYHIHYQYLFDRHFACQYPEIEFSRWGNDVFIINQFDSKREINDTEILSFLDSLDPICGEVHSIYSSDAHKLEYCESPHNGMAFNIQTYWKIFLHDCGKVTVQKNDEGNFEDLNTYWVKHRRYEE